MAIEVTCRLCGRVTRYDHRDDVSGRYERCYDVQDCIAYLSERIGRLERVHRPKEE